MFVSGENSPRTLDGNCSAGAADGHKSHPLHWNKSLKSSFTPPLSTSSLLGGQKSREGEERERQNSFLRVALFLPQRENVLPAEEDRGTFARGKGTKSPFLRPSSRRKRGEDFELEVVGRVTLSLWRHLVSQPLPPSPPTSFLGVTWPSGDSPSFERRHWATHSFLPRGKFFSRLSLRSLLYSVNRWGAKRKEKDGRPSSLLLFPGRAAGCPKSEREERPHW